MARQPSFLLIFAALLVSVILHYAVWLMVSTLWGVAATPPQGQPRIRVAAITAAAPPISAPSSHAQAPHSQTVPVAAHNSLNVNKDQPLASVVHTDLVHTHKEPTQVTPEQRINTEPTSSVATTVHNTATTAPERNHEEGVPSMPVAVASINTGIAVEDTTVLASVEEAYRLQLLQWLGKHRRYPSVAKRRGQEGVVTLELVITADGQLVSYHLKEQSPFKVLNEAVKKMVVAAAPYPKMPVSTQKKHQEFRYVIPIQFQLAGG